MKVNVSLSAESTEKSDFSVEVKYFGKEMMMKSGECVYCREQRELPLEHRLGDQDFCSHRCQLLWASQCSRYEQQMCAEPLNPWCGLSKSHQFMS